MNLIRKFGKVVKIYRCFSDQNNTLIYQMGKVGSTSLEQSLEGSLNVHTLYRNSPCKVNYLAKIKQSNLFRIQDVFLSWMKRYALKKRDKINIIVVVRDPVARNRSMFFQDLYHWLSYSVNHNQVNNKAEGIQVIMDAYNNCFDHEYPVLWFDKELKKFTGIDIFNYKYEKGGVIIKNGKYNICLIKLDELDDNISIVEGFLDQKVTLVDSNISEKKWYSEVYKSFNKELSLTEKEKLVLNSKMAKHFGF